MRAFARRTPRTEAPSSTARTDRRRADRHHTEQVRLRRATLAGGTVLASALAAVLALQGPAAAPAPQTGVSDSAAALVTWNRTADGGPAGNSRAGAHRHRDGRSP